MRQMFRNEDGVALITALMTLVVVSLLGAAALTIASGTINQTVWDRSSNQAFQVAEAGFDQAVARIRNDDGDDDFVAQLLTGEADVTITQLNLFMYRVKSTGAQPTLADPKARRAVEAVVMHLDPSDVFFADSAQGTVLGSTTFEGPLYVRDLMNISGNSKLDGGPFFIKDNPATVDPTGDLIIDGSSSMGEAAPIYLFIDGNYDPTANINTEEVFTDVPDLNMPIVDADDMAGKRADADLVIDDDASNNGSNPLSFDQNTADFFQEASPGGPYLKWTKSSKTLEIDGMVFVDGSFSLGSNQLNDITYEGIGTVTANGNIGIASGFAPSPTSDFPATSAFGLITPYEMDVTAKTGKNISGVLYAYEKLHMYKPIEFYGNAMSQVLDFDENPHVVVASDLNKSNLPPGMPVMDPMTTISGWREVTP